MMDRVKSAIRSLPGANLLKSGLQAAWSAPMSPFLRRYPPGHYYSPVPDLKYGLRREGSVFDSTTRTCAGIDIREEQQLNLLDKMAAYYGDLPFPELPGTATRYWYQNSYFTHADGIVLYALLRVNRPSRVIEIGSGFSSAVILDTNERFLANAMRCTFVDPDPIRLFQIFHGEDIRRHDVVTAPVQDLDVERFRALESGDILFVDSSHVAKVGSDVLTVFFGILPELRPGVLVHFHDILWPFQYPKSWF